MSDAIILIGLVFCPIAGAMAYLITYEEYQHHGFGRRQLIARSLQAAVVAALFFALAGVALGALLPSIFGQPG